MADKFKSGYAALIGRPNVGKSTLINAILGESLSIVTDKPQTTRHRITGILNRADSQIIFLDTPGYHRSDKPLNIAMNDIVDAVIDDTDVVCLIISADQDETRIERDLVERIGVHKCILVINKADLISRNEFDSLAKRYKDSWGVNEIVILSALRNLGVHTLVDAIRDRLPGGPAYFSEDLYTDHPVRFLAAELIRQQLFLQMQQELPYSAAVEMEEFKDATDENPVTRIKASIIVEKDSQKAMVIGKGGARIKEIGKKARQKIEGLVGGKVFLELFVRVEKNWTKDRNLIKKLGYTNQMD